MTRACIWCKQEITANLSFIMILSFKSLHELSGCDQCLEKLERISVSSACIGCSRQVKKNTFCQDCKRWKLLYPQMDFSHQALFSYNQFGKEWMERFKFVGDIEVVEMIALIMKKELRKYRKSHVLVPIPISDVRFAERGFNQVEVLLDHTGMSYQQVLMNKGTSAKQSSKNRQQRLDTEQPFYVKVEKKNVIYKKKILVVDDVYTTGRTLFHARDCLLRAGAQRVDTFSVFR